MSLRRASYQSSVSFFKASQQVQKQQNVQSSNESQKQAGSQAQPRIENKTLENLPSRRWRLYQGSPATAIDEEVSAAKVSYLQRSSPVAAPIQPTAFEEIKPQSEQAKQSPSLSWWRVPLRKRYWLSTATMCLLVILLGIFEYQQVRAVAVENTSPTYIIPEHLEGYAEWSAETIGWFADPESDLDGDELLNREEYFANSDPTSVYSCEAQNNLTDAQSVREFINPGTCNPFDFENEDDIDLLYKLTYSINTSPTEQKTTDKQDSQTNELLETFNVDDLEKITTRTPEQIAADKRELDEQTEYLELIAKIDRYINIHRSNEIYDRNYEAPVGGEVYLDVSLRYNVPLKYVLTIARTESRFGTDRYTNSGNLTRPGQYRNIYSIGLTDGGQNIAYPTWEAGVEGFGKWYRKFDDRGVSDCQKWRIYNPNGDYCAKVEGIANQVEAYLNS
jgi:hypothetical protein